MSIEDGLVVATITISLDGFVAGPDQSLDHPLGERGEELHEWLFSDAEPASAEVTGEILGGAAVIQGRNMFGPVRGEWPDDAWKGWWGDDPPYHVPVFVLTHHEREPVEMLGGTTFHFVTGGIEEALERARAAAGGGRISVAGGASTIRQFLSAGLLDRLILSIAPITLGAGERLFDGVAIGGDAGIRLRPVQVFENAVATHIVYDVVR
ncbi:dihydrofolate reductase family protein [Agromyces salentinus]|uniref:Dihydrofolate reductase family protein n=1 Tax=Agromyces salentinus TaxID=269421 RepID=A0ABN2MHN8_9MICO|nr:dihydrofolate reductase family protein [Agromyces salentinus]